MDHVQGDRGRMPEERRALFQRCRGIDPAVVARDAGITVTRKGGRNFCLCPFHAESTPSLLLDERGSWHCFGCGRGGDTAAFYAGLYGVGPISAALLLRQKYLPAAPQCGMRNAECGMNGEGAAKQWGSAGKSRREEAAMQPGSNGSYVSHRNTEESGEGSL